ncbi:MAG: T9SS type A sorting domain-containing protein [Flavobacteriales bacterium]|nr:T9SS type A sorting domain-containing protein [Flavobacteriales bacterium]
MILLKRLSAAALLLSFIASQKAEAQNALSYDGTDDYVQTTFPGISGNLNRTVEAWIRTTANSDPGTGGHQLVIVDWGSMSLGQRSTFCMVAGNAIRFEVGGNGLSGSVAINDGLWHHVAVTYTSTVSVNQVKLYLDGQLEAQGNLTQPVNSSQINNLMIGRRNDGVNYFEGDIDEVRVWNIARTQAEIQADMNSEFCSPPTGLAVYYKANEGVAGGNNAGSTNMPNHVSSNYDGTLMNFALNGSSSNWIAGSSISTGNTTASFQVDGCNQYIAPSGQVCDSTGIYTDVIANASGCDSVMTIDVNITDIDVDVTDNGDNTLTANQAGASYQWLNCTQGFAYISGATGQTFVPTQNGQFAVEVTLNGCVDSSSCYNITSIGLPDVEDEQIAVYPNPAAGRITLEAPAPVSFEVFDMQGRSIYTVKNPAAKTVIDASEWARGTYLVLIHTDQGLFTDRIVIQ